MTNDKPNTPTPSTRQGEGTPNFMRKRFYKDVTTAAADAKNGVALQLDTRTVRTPAKNELALPTRTLAEAIADEWRAQEDFINPATMPLTRLANTAIDGVAQNLDDVRADAAKYAGSDLLCYRAESPKILVARQTAAWDPVIATVSEILGASFVTTSGIMPADQPPETLAKVTTWFNAHDAFAVAALHVITTISGSCILAIAHAEGHMDIDTLWNHAHLDEDYQMEQWGRDEEALKMRTHRHHEITAAATFLQRAQ